MNAPASQGCHDRAQSCTMPWWPFSPCHIQPWTLHWRLPKTGPSFLYHPRVVSQVCLMYQCYCILITSYRCMAKDSGLEGPGVAYRHQEHSEVLVDEIPIVQLLLRFTWTLFFSSYTYSTLTHISHTYDSSLPHLLHSDSYLSRLWLIAPTLTPPWLIHPYCTLTIYTARYPLVTLAWSYSNIPEF